MAVLGLVMGLVVGVGGCGIDLGGTDDAATTTRPLPEPDELCDLGRDNDQEVKGHDLAASTELSDGRILFVFGDTYVGDAPGPARAARLLPSSAAVLPAGADPCRDRLEYLTGPTGEVRPLLPRPGRVTSRLWPIDVATLDGQVWMLYRWVQRVGEGILDVEVRGTGLAVAQEDDLTFVPFERLLSRGPRPLPTALAVDGDALVVLVCDGGGQDPADRCRLHGLDRDRPAVGDRVEGVPALDLATAEMSLARVRRGGATVWRVGAMPDLACSLKVAELRSGRWEVQVVREPEVPDGRLCYAGRLQEVLSEGRDVVLTWVDSAEPPTDSDLYWPHMERVRLR